MGISHYVPKSELPKMSGARASPVAGGSPARQTAARGDCEARQEGRRRPRNQDAGNGDRHDRFRPDVRWDSQCEATLEVIRLLAPRLRALGVRVAIETHADLTLDEMLALLDRLGPDIAGVTLDQIGDGTTITITGQQFDGSCVVFRQGTREIVVTPSPSDTTFTVPFPPSMFVGLTDILVRHPKYGESNSARLAPTGGLAAYPSTSGDVTFFSGIAAISLL